MVSNDKVWPNMRINVGVIQTAIFTVGQSEAANSRLNEFLFFFS